LGTGAWISNALENVFSTDYSAKYDVLTVQLGRFGCEGGGGYSDKNWRGEKGRRHMETAKYVRTRPV